MKNTLLIKTLAALMLALTIQGPALAGNTASLTVSCSIPIMPGLNAPLIEEKTVKTPDSSAMAEKKIETGKELLQDTTALPQQGTDREEIVTEDANPAMTVKTYYSR